MKMPSEINEYLLAWIVEQVFDGAIEDDRVIRDIYRLIALDQADFVATGYAQHAPASLQSVLGERIRQLQVECHLPEMDDEHTDGALAVAASCYVAEAALQATDTRKRLLMVPEAWPWTAASWRPSSQRRNLIKAGALILAEIDRLDRAKNLTSKERSNV